MDNDFSDLINKMSDILKSKDIDINSMISKNETCVEDNQNSSDSNDFNLDIETILKIKEIITKINSNKDSKRNKLLQSLKPYLKNTQKEKLETYCMIANILCIFEEYNTNLPFLSNKKGYDYILIITLVLLII